MQFTDEQWRKKLSKPAYHVLRKKGTETPHSGSLLHNKETGMYVCGGCGAVLFDSKHKYDSATPGLIGWPSFSAANNDNAVILKPDNSIGMHRTEVCCAKCGGHLGHVFDANDSPTGQHYCINSVALNFKKEEK